jgi:hypothetical protein
MDRRFSIVIKEQENKALLALQAKLGGRMSAGAVMRMALMELAKMHGVKVAK